MAVAIHPADGICVGSHGRHEPVRGARLTREALASPRRKERHGAHCLSRSQGLGEEGR